MKRFIRYALFILFAIAIVLASWYPLHGDIYFTADIARDFWLLEELDAKKLVLIGPRASGELYHGPVWTYLTYPAYGIGRGNPVVVGWYWVILAVGGVVAGFFVAKKLFGKQPAWAFALMFSLYLTFHTRSFSHPSAAMLLVPVWFFLFVRYIQSSKKVFLISHIVLSGILIQLELAVGTPLTLLSIVALIWHIRKKRRYTHLLFLGILPLTLINFFIFDLRHDHILFTKLLDFVGPKQEGEIFHYAKYIGERVWLLFSSPEILRRDPGYRNFFLFLFLLVFLAFQIRQNKYRPIYFSFLFFYTGFFLLSFIDKGPLLYFHIYPLFPFVFLIFSSFFTSRYKKVFIWVFVVVYGFNLTNSIRDVRGASGFIGKDRESWKALKEVSLAVLEDAPQSFGYFVFSPDITGYGPKYAMRYVAKQFDKEAHSFQKRPTTYLVLSPPPRNNPSMNGTWWRKNQLGIAKDPDSTKTFENGFVVEKYTFTVAEQAVPFDPALDPGLHFR